MSSFNEMVANAFHDYEDSLLDFSYSPRSYASRHSYEGHHHTSTSYGCVHAMDTYQTHDPPYVQATPGEYSPPANLSSLLDSLATRLNIQPNSSPPSPPHPPQSLYGHLVSSFKGPVGCLPSSLQPSRLIGTVVGPLCNLDLSFQSRPHSQGSRRSQGLPSTSQVDPFTQILLSKTNHMEGQLTKMTNVQNVPVVSMPLAPSYYIPPSQVPKYPIYNGKCNPFLHIKDFKYDSTYWHNDKKVLEYLFGKSLDGSDLEWSYSLEPNEVVDFEIGKRKFLKSYRDHVHPTVSIT